MNCGIKDVIKECKKDVYSGKCSDCYFHDKPAGCFEALDDAMQKLALQKKNPKDGE